MKNNIFLLVYVLMLNNALLSQEEERNYFLDNIDINFIGYYVSVNFMASIESNKSYALARNTIHENTYYAHIMVFENNMICYPFYSDTYFEVSVDEFTEYKFEIIENEMFIIDFNGNKYKKMTSSVDYEMYYQVMNNFIGNIVLIDFINNGKIIIENDYIYIPSLDNKKFGISTWLMYGNEANLVIYDENNSWIYIEINDNELILYRIVNRGKSILWRINI